MIIQNIVKNLPDGYEGSAKGFLNKPLNGRENKNII